MPFILGPQPYALNPRNSVPRAEQPRAPSLCRSSSRPSRKLGCWDSCRRMLSTFTPPTTRFVSLNQPRSLSAFEKGTTPRKTLHMTACYGTGWKKETCLESEL